ncbi:MAG: cytochrome c [Gammaproteobacteria bacterium]|nr:cytochrome c [Gammaproteobacteria bacterium]MBU1655895.1 cytochrome c [Gammaproteobacteria bacterium]MBU1961008.1 cytochrome c [Gammaproteobacteria bacterium]
MPFLLVLSAGKSLADEARQQELRQLIKHDCGSCHGLTLQGGLGPSLTPERLKPFTPEQLAMTIVHGRPGTAMPPWRPFLSDAEAMWLAQGLKTGELP